MKHKISALMMLALLTGCGGETNSLTKGEDALSVRDFRAATIEFKSELQKNPNSYQARLGLGKTLVKQRKFSEAIFELQHVVKNEAVNEKLRNEAFELLAFSYHELRETDKLMAMPRENYAVAYFQLIQNIDTKPSQPPIEKQKEVDEFKALYNLASRENRSELNELLSYFESANNEIIKGQIALLIAERGASENNLQTIKLGLKKYTETHPLDAARQLQYIDFLVNTQQASQAKESALSLIKQNPRHPLLNELMASIYLDESDFDNALSHSRISIADNPRSARARMVAALSEVGKQNTKAALEHLAFVVDALPSDHPMRLLQADLLMQSGEYPEAVAKLKDFTPSQDEQVEQIAKMGLYLNSNNNKALSKTLLQNLENKNVVNTVSLSMLRLSLDEPNAIDDLNTLREKKPDSEFLNHTVAAAYLASNDLTKAESLANEWMNQGGEKEYDGLLLKAIVATRKDKHSEAYTLFSKLMEKPSVKPIVISGAIESGVRAGFKDKILSILETERDADNIEMYLISYLSAMQSIGFGDEAVTELNKLKNLSRKPHVIALKIAQHHASTGKTELAIELLESNKAKLSDRVDYWATLAVSRQNQLDFKSAALAYSEWVKMEPKSKPALLGLVAALDASLQIKDALNALRASKTNHKDDPVIDILTVQLLAKHQMWDDAINEIGKLPKSVSSLPPIEAAEGAALVATGKFREAEPKLISAITHSPSSELLTFLVVAQEKLGKPNEAKENIKSYITKHPNEVIGHVLLGNNRGAASDWIAAEAAFRKAIELGANSALVLNNYAYSLSQNGKLSEAEIAAKKAVEMAPGNLSTKDTLAGIWLKMGKNQEIIDMLSEVELQNDLPDTMRKILDDAKRKM